MRSSNSIPKKVFAVALLPSSGQQRHTETKTFIFAACCYSIPASKGWCTSAACFTAFKIVSELWDVQALRHAVFTTSLEEQKEGNELACAGERTWAGWC